jgi:hypothetical protein
VIRITNNSGWRNAWIDHMIAYCAGEVGLPLSGLCRAWFTRTIGHENWGSCALGQKDILVQLNPMLPYPRTVRNDAVATDVTYQDPVELLVELTGHELAHLAQPAAPESRIVARGWAVLCDFRRRRAALMAAWGDPGKGPVRPTSMWRGTCTACDCELWYLERPPAATYCPHCFPRTLVCEQAPTPAKWPKPHSARTAREELMELLQVEGAP